MGIFSFFSRDNDDEPVTTTPVETDELDDEESAPAKRPSTVPLPDLHKDMTIEVMDDHGQVLNVGTITDVSRKLMVLGRLPGGLSFKMCEPGTEVTLRGCDSKMSQFYLRATVEECTRVLIRLKDMVHEVHENHRDNFRLMVNEPIAI